MRRKKMKVKDGVSLFGLKIEMRIVLKEADRIWKSYGHELVVTSTTDGVHSAGSYHPYGYAVDLRTNYFGELEVDAVAQELRNILSFFYDVVVESTHIHVEYDYNRANS